MVVMVVDQVHQDILVKVAVVEQHRSLKLDQAQVSILLQVVQVAVVQVVLIMVRQVKIHTLQMELRILVPLAQV